MADDVVVVWDGRRHGPGGAFLFAPESETRPAPPTNYRVRSGLRESVVAALSLGPATVPQLSELTEFSTENVSEAIRALRVFGSVVVVKPGGGRGGRNIYGLTPV